MKPWVDTEVQPNLPEVVPLRDSLAVESRWIMCLTLPPLPGMSHTGMRQARLIQSLDCRVKPGNDLVLDESRFAQPGLRPGRIPLVLHNRKTAQESRAVF